MAPEVMRGTKYDASVDIYSLGLVLYRLLNNNRLPFLPPAPAPITFSQREAAQAKRMSGVSVPPPVNGNEALKNAVLKAVSFEPSERFSNAASMRAALEESGNIGVSFDELRESSQKANIISYDDTEYFNTQVDKTVVEAPTVTASELETEMHNGQTNEKTGGGKKKIVGLIGIIAAAVIGFIIIAVIFFNGSRTEFTYTPVAETETESSDASANNDESSEKKSTIVEEPAVEEPAVEQPAAEQPATDTKESDADSHFLEYLKGNEKDANGEKFWAVGEPDMEYALYDMNGDGVNELIVRSYGYWIYDIIE
jgi:serine/threonine protein kinase